MQGPRLKLGSRRQTFFGMGQIYTAPSQKKTSWKIKLTCFAQRDIKILQSKWTRIHWMNMSDWKILFVFNNRRKCSFRCLTTFLSLFDYKFLKNDVIEFIETQMKPSESSSIIDDTLNILIWIFITITISF